MSRAAASALMCSYNEVNGVPSCANQPLLDQAKAWGFQGYITSDCGAVDDVYTTHKYAPTPPSAVADVLNAGHANHTPALGGEQEEGSCILRPLPVLRLVLM